MSKLSAHRGGPEAIFEPNSLAAITAAVELGVDLVEFDVRVTRDRRFVIWHDDRVSVEGRLQAIGDLDADELLRVAPSAVLLEDVLEAIKGKAMGHVDLKDTSCEVEIADLCTSVLGPHGFVLTTLEDVSVRRLRDARPELLVALSLGRDSARLGRLQILLLRWSEVFPQARVGRCGANMLAVNYQLARVGVLAWAHRRGIPVLIWTLNTDRLIRRAQADPRVWAYTTDRPRAALRLAASGR